MVDRSCYVSQTNKDSGIEELRRQIEALQETVDCQANKIECQALEILEYSRALNDLRQEVKAVFRANAPFGV